MWRRQRRRREPTPCARIEQVIGAYVSGKAKAENGQLIDSLVTEKFGGFAQIVRVLSQKQDDGMFEIQAEVAVSPVPMLRSCARTASCASGE